MRRLYLQIYLAFLGILLLFGVLVTVASLLIPLHPQDHLLFNGIGAVLSELLPGPQRPAHELQAAVEHLRRLLPIDLTVHSADGALLAAVGPLCRRLRRSIWYLDGCGPGALAQRLPWPCQTDDL
jgi:hypothetical protein